MIDIEEEVEIEDTVGVVVALKAEVEVEAKVRIEDMEEAEEVLEITKDALKQRNKTIKGRESIGLDQDRVLDLKVLLQAVRVLQVEAAGLDQVQADRLLREVY